MMNRHPLVRAFEDEWLRRQPLDYERNLRIFEALDDEAVELGVLPPKDPLEGIEHVVWLARALKVPGVTGAHLRGAQ